MLHHHQQNQPIIKLCLNDSIFKNIYHGQHQQQTQYNYQPITHHSHTKIQTNLTHQPHSIITHIQYLNAQYYGFTSQNKPNGTGIFIDDEFNFFLSSYQNTNMNKLSFIKLLNQKMIYGTWINGKLNGWTCIKIKNLSIFIQIKNIQKLPKQPHINKNSINENNQVALIIDNLNSVSYLLQITNPSKLQFQQQKIIPKFKIINRKSIPTHFKSNNISINQIFTQINFKIPHYLLSLQSFFNHLTQNNPNIVFKQIFTQSQKYYYLSLKNYQQLNNNSVKPFNPYKKFFHQNNMIDSSISKPKLLGLILNKKTQKTKSIGQFDNKSNLQGLGINFTNNDSLMFGQFKSNLLTKQFDHCNQLLTKQSFKSRKLKKQIMKHHMKSHNFVNDFIYFSEISQFSSLANQINEYVKVFQHQFTHKYGKPDSFSISQQSFDQKYQFNDKEQVYQRYRENYQKKNIFAKQQGKKQLNQNSLKRPIGKIVNSRSPLRKENKFHSKSHSEVSTFRQRSPINYNINSYYADRSVSKDKNVKPLLISINSSQFNSRYNKQTSKNSKYLDRNMNSSGNKRLFLAKKRQLDQQQQIIQTVRQRNEYYQRQIASRKRQLYDKQQSNRNYQHLYNNYHNNNNNYTQQLYYK